MKPKFKNEFNIGTRIKECREALGLSRNVVCDMLGGISLTTLTLWEKNEREPQAGVLIKLAEILKTTPTYLLAGNKEEIIKAEPANISNQLTVEQALQALQRAIERQKPKDNTILDGQPLKVEEMTVIRNYRKTDDRGREAILTLSFSMLGFATNTASDNDKDEAIAKAANGS
ncbi:helix-turn-helix domain-containing protein [Gallibacterium salpingitidis]|uniref:helix-turn-helix domain-containing protein n=1 Tax=Gallibacterium salpingitidis TaxID=505341 RepID=UPI000825E894|nr:helix-turn-helix transcriptional regulator [Gallibacterium salpingitidis]